MLTERNLREMMLMLMYSYLYTVKLVTGEHLLVTFLNQNAEKITFKYPMLMKPISVPSEVGFTELEMGIPWMISAESRVHEIEKKHIMMLQPMGPRAAKLYMSLLEKYDFDFLENDGLGGFLAEKTGLSDFRIPNNKNVGRGPEQKKQEPPAPKPTPEEVNEFLQKIENELDLNDLENLDDLGEEPPTV